MTETEAEQIAAMLVEAYPGSYFEGPTRVTFVNSLMVSDHARAKATVQSWIERSEHFPTAAEINSAIHQQNESSQTTTERREAATGPAATREQACEAFSRGYIRARTEAGEAMETIQPKLDRLLKQWGLNPTSEAEPPEHTGSGRKPTVPSRHRPGYLRSSSAPPVDQPAFDGSTNDEPW